MLQDLKIINGNLSLKFDPLNTKYTVIMNNNDNELKILKSYTISNKGDLRLILQKNFCFNFYYNFSLW